MPLQVGSRLTDQVWVILQVSDAVIARPAEELACTAPARRRIRAAAVVVVDEERLAVGVGLFAYRAHATLLLCDRLVIVHRHSVQATQQVPALAAHAGDVQAILL